MFDVHGLEVIMIPIDWDGVAAYAETPETRVLGHADGYISVIGKYEKLNFRNRLHEIQVTDVAVIDEVPHFVRICSADEAGNFIIFNLTWRDCLEAVASIEYRHTFQCSVHQLSNCYPKHACVGVVTNDSCLSTINWRTGEVRKLNLLTKGSSYMACGILFNRRSDLFYVSLMTKNGLKVITVDLLSMTLINIFHVEKLPYYYSQPWSKLLWYCDRFILCHTDKFIAILDPVACCTVNFVEMAGDEEILLLSVNYADVVVVLSKRVNPSLGSNVAFETVSKLLGLRDLLLMAPFTAIDDEIHLPAVESIKEEPENIHISSVKDAGGGDQLVEDADLFDNSSSSSRSDSLHVPITELHPKLTEWVERPPVVVPKIFLGEFASDSNLPSGYGMDSSEPSVQEREHSSSFSHPPPSNDGAETIVSAASAQPSIRPAISADDRLMKLFFPADYDDNQCPFPSQPAASDEALNTPREQGALAVVDDSSMNSVEIREANESIPSIMWLDFWPIWLDMPLLWTSSVTSTGPAAALFGALKPTSISLSKHHIYVTDSTSRLSYASLDCKTVRWQIAQDASPADQVSSSPQGDILWLLRAGSVFAAQMVSASSPVGSRWERILLDVTYIHVTDGRAFYIRRDGALMMQNGLSSRRSSYVSVQLHSPFRLKAVVLAGLDLWGQCVDGRIVHNSRLLSNSSKATGRRDESLAGEWQVDKMAHDTSNIVSIFAGPFNTIIVADEFCRLWMHRSSTSPSYCLADHLLPITKGKYQSDWWLIPMPRNQDTLNDNLPKAWPLFVASCKDTVLITVPSMATGALQLYLSKGHMLGQQLRRIKPNGAALTTKWRSVYYAEASEKADEQDASDSNETAPRNIRRACFAWLVGETGDLLRLDFTTLNAVSPSPIQLRSATVKMVSMGQDVSWTLLDDGNVWACHHHTGQVDRWAQLDLAQLADEFLPVVDIAVGPRLVWILAASGALFFRIGVSILSSSAISQPALCRLTDDATSGHPDVPLRRIYASPSQDWMIFALPAPGCSNPRPIFRGKNSLPSEAYDLAPLARMGVTADVPIGALWHPVIGGPPMIDLALSASAGLFGLPDIARMNMPRTTSLSAASLSQLASSSSPTPANNSVIFWRSGVRQQDPTGSYWKKVVDGASQMSVGDNQGQMCLIGTDGSLYVHAVCCLAASLTPQDELSASSAPKAFQKPRVDSELAGSGGWELI